MLSDLQQQKLTHYFNILDFDKNGILEKEDFTAVGENLAILWGFRYGTSEYNACISRIEQNWNDFRSFTKWEDPDKATLQEWLDFGDKALIHGEEEFYQRYVIKVAEEIFDFFDTDKDGHIALNEYIDLFMAFRIEIRYSAKSYTRLDLNSDDQLSREEMVSAVDQFFRSDDEDAPGNWLFGFWGTNRM